MAHFAEIDNKGMVVRVIVAEQDFIDLMPGKWVQTSYNTRGGAHPEGRPLRKNYAGVGYTYDAGRDAFVPPKPHQSWRLNAQTCFWEAPVAYPQDGKSYEWDEKTRSWVVTRGFGA